MEKIFKAMRIDNGEWFEFNLFKHITPEKNGLDTTTICQYTGIDAQNGKIFEGDEVYVAGVGNVIVTITANGVMFGDEDYQSCIEDIERLTAHNIHDKD